MSNNLAHSETCESPKRYQNQYNTSNKDMPDSDYFEGLTWTVEAKVKYKNIPYFVRTRARQRIEQMAQASGSDTITAEIVEKARVEFGQ